MKRILVIVSIAVLLFLAFTTGRGFLIDRWAIREVEKSRAGLAEISAPDYQPLLDLESNSHFDVRNIYDYGQAKFQHKVLVGSTNAPLLFFSDSKVGYQSFLLDHNANILLTITAKGGVDPVGDYLITREGYYSFLLDGNPELIPYGTYVSDAPVTEDIIIKLYEESPYYTYEDYGVRDENNRYLYQVYAHYFFRQGRWIAVKVDFDLDQTLDRKIEKFGSNKGAKEFTRAFPKDYDDEEHSASFFNGRVNMTLDHFLKEEYHRPTSPVLGDPTGNSKPAYWSGKAFYTLTFDGKMIKFYVPTEYHGRLSLHGADQLNFVILRFNQNQKDQNIIISLKPAVSSQ